MRKKALIIVAIMIILNTSLLVVRLCKPTLASAKVEVISDNETKTTEEIKDIEVKTNEESTKKSPKHIDMVAYDYATNVVDVKNTEFVIPQNLLDDLNNTLSSYPQASSFMVVSLNDGMSFGYNIDQAYGSGSTIKATYAYYVYKLVAEKKASLDDTIAYQAKFYNSGTGSIKHAAYGTEYTVRQLLYEMIHESDNVAYLMLLDKYKWDGFNEMLDDLGAVELHLSNTSRWGKLSCRSSAIIWQEIYKFSQESAEGKELMDLFLNAKYNYFKEILPDVASASKSGFTQVVVHDTGIVMDEENPYIIIILSNTGGNMSAAYAHVKNMFSKIAPIMQEYNNFIRKK